MADNTINTLALNAVAQDLLNRDDLPGKDRANLEKIRDLTRPEINLSGRKQVTLRNTL